MKKFLFLLTAVLLCRQIQAQTAIATINYTGFLACGGCTVCGSDYWCFNTISSYCGNTASCGTDTFFDPVPPGNIVTNIQLHFFTGECSGGSLTATLNDTVVFPIVYEGNGGCLCSNNPCSDSATTFLSFSCGTGMPGYNYGADNFLEICTGTDVCINKLELIISYGPPDTSGTVPVQPDTVFGNLSVCSGTSQTYSINGDSGVAYSWALPPGWAIDSGQGGASISVVAGDSSGNICVAAYNSCMTSAQTCIAVSSTPNDILIDAAGPFCFTDSSVTLNSDSSGGVWSGTGITDSSAGTFSPLLAGVGTHIISYSLFSMNCTKSDTTEIFVDTFPDASIVPVEPMCITDSSVNLEALNEGGTWNGNGITDSLDGIFSPDSAGSGTHLITYSLFSIGCSITDTDTLEIYVGVIPDATISAVEQMCVNDSSIVLNAATSGGIWSGEVDSLAGIFEPDSAGIHIINYIVEDGGCTASDTVEIVVNTLPDAEIIATGQTVFCDGDSVIIISNYAEEYLWSSGDTTQYIIVFESGNYSVTVTDNNGCSSSSNIVQVTVLPVPATPVISNNGGVLTSSSPIGNQWYVNGFLIDSATSQTYIAPIDGVYYVVVTDSNGCSSESNLLLVNVNAVLENITDDAIIIFPNPSDGKFKIQNEKGKIQSIEIYNVLGEKIYFSTMKQFNNLTIDISSHSKGIYFVKLQTEQEVQVKKVIMQ